MGEVATAEWKQQIGTVAGYRVYVVNDNWVKVHYDADFAEGANHGARPYVPEGEVWVSDLMSTPTARLATIGHEVGEDMLIGAGASYDEAHEAMAELEQQLRPRGVDKWLQSVSADEAEAEDVGEGVEKACKPRGGESKDNFIGRCIRTARHEGKDEDQAAGMCYGIWNEHKSMAGARVLVKGIVAALRKAMGLKAPAVEQEERSGEWCKGLETVVAPPEGGDGPPLGHRLMSARLARARGVLRLAVAAKAGSVAPGMNVDAAELYAGTMEEMEHTEDWREAMRIALDHLAQVPDYYTRLREAGLMSAEEI